MPRTFPRFAHDHSDKRSLLDHSRFTTLNFPQSPRENRRSPRRKRVDSSEYSPGDLLLVRIFSPILDSGDALESYDVEREIRRTPRVVEEHEERWTALPTLPASGAHHVREFLGDVREFRLHISLAFADRRGGGTGSSLSPSGARARPPVCPACRLFLWGPQPSVRLIHLRSKAYRGRKGDKALA